MKYIFGPVPSRRLGYSLGIDILPKKTCNMDCIYCELGRSGKRVKEARTTPPWREIIEEIKQYCAIHGRSFDCLTFTASGEPTLNKDLATLITHAKNITRTPVAILTNSSTVMDKTIRDTLKLADIVLPSLDAATERTFKRINRPHPSLDIKKIIEGLTLLRQEMQGRMWLEVLFVRDVNDTQEELEALKKAIDRINPHKIQLNTVARPPAESWAKPITSEKMERICSFFGHKAEIVIDFKAQMEKGEALILESEIVDTLKRRPLTIQDFQALFGKYAETKKILSGLIEKGVVAEKMVQNKTFYVALTGAK